MFINFFISVSSFQKIFADFCFTEIFWERFNLMFLRNKFSNIFSKRIQESKSRNKKYLQNELTKVKKLLTIFTEFQVQIFCQVYRVLYLVNAES